MAPQSGFSPPVYRNLRGYALDPSLAQTRRLSRATNPDMLAFHEAFADIVALFQHFTFPATIRHQIGFAGLFPK